MMRSIERAPVIFFGSGTYGAAMNMAIDEAMMNRAAESGNTYVRFYAFERPAVILSSSDHWKAVKEGNTERVAVVRRITAGKPIYVDDGTLCYSFAGPIHPNNGTFSNASEIHAYFGSIIADVIRSTIGSEQKVELGKAYSIRVRGRPIAGHGQYLSTDSYLYHGIVAVRDWDINKIFNVLHLGNEDVRELKGLPSVSSFSKLDPELLKKEMARRTLVALRSVQMDDAEVQGILKRAKALEGRYRLLEWLHRKDIQLKQDSRFCLLYEG